MADSNTSGATFQAGRVNVTSAVALANASLIAVGVVKGITTTAVADSINGNPLMREQLMQAACTRITKRLSERLDQARVARLMK